jgi:hypothetical protein
MMVLSINLHNTGDERKYPEPESYGQANKLKSKSIGKRLNLEKTRRKIVDLAKA